MAATGTATRWVLGTVLSVGALVASGTAVSDDSDVAARRRFRHALLHALGRGATPAMLDELHARARDAGEMHVRGRHHFSGEVLASRLTVEAGSQVTIEAGTVIYVAGDMTIDAPLVMTPLAGAGFVTKAAVKGANGASRPNVVLACGGNGAVDGVDAAAGADGADVNDPAGAVGGDGGNGATVELVCSGPLTLHGAIRPGAGGRGGDAVSIGKAGCPGGDARAKGGKGGHAGWVSVRAPSITVTAPDGGIALAPGGRGGNGTALSGRGSDGDPCTDRQSGCWGGSASAQGGDAGAGSYAQVVITDAAGTITGKLAVEASLGIGAPGGAAHATSGDGGAGFGCDQGCPDAGRAGGDGGCSLEAQATGGEGQLAAFLSVLGPIRSTSEGGPGPGPGGDAIAQGGNGGNGGFGQTAKSPGWGGSGGVQGGAHATGGPGGYARTRAGGTGGFAAAHDGDQGDGGRGGDCCDRPGGKGAVGGGLVFRSHPRAVGGKGGAGTPNGDVGGAETVEGLPGTRGPKGADCPGSDAGTTVEVTVGTGDGVGTMAAAFAAVQPGDTIEVETQQIQWPITAPPLTTAAVTIHGHGATIVGDGGSQVVIDAPGIHWESLNLDGVSLLVTATADGLVLSSSLFEGGANVTVQGAEDVVFDSDEWKMLEPASFPLLAFDGYDLFIRNCVFHSISAGARLAQCARVTIDHSLFEDMDVAIEALQSTDMTLAGLEISANLTGLDLTNCHGVRVDGATIKAPTCVQLEGGDYEFSHVTTTPSPTGGTAWLLQGPPDPPPFVVRLVDITCPLKGSARGVVGNDFDYFDLADFLFKGKTTATCIELHPKSDAVVNIERGAVSGAARGAVINCAGTTGVAATVDDVAFSKCPEDGLECVGGDGGGECRLRNDTFTRCGTAPGGAGLDCTVNGDQILCEDSTFNSCGYGIVLADLPVPSAGHFTADFLTLAKNRGDAILVGVNEVLHLGPLTAAGNRGAVARVHTGGRLYSYPDVVENLLSPKAKTPAFDFDPPGWGAEGIDIAVDAFNATVTADWATIDPAVDPDDLDIDALLRGKSPSVTFPYDLDVDAAGRSTIDLCDEPAGPLSVAFSTPNPFDGPPMVVLGEARVTRPKGKCGPPDGGGGGGGGGTSDPGNLRAIGWIATSPIVAGQPMNVSVTVKNVGATAAVDVKVEVFINEVIAGQTTVANVPGGSEASPGVAPAVLIPVTAPASGTGKLLRVKLNGASKLVTTFDVP